MTRWHFRPTPAKPRAPYSDENAPLPYPTGWFMLAPSRDLRPGTVSTRRLMGEDVVLYRTRRGQARVIRPYCPHLGAHLGYGGRVDGELLVCPFHHFAFDTNGAVTRPGPGYTGQTLRNSLSVLPSQEANGAIFTWVGADPAQPPSWPLPDLLPAATPAARFAHTELGTHPQEIMENGVDIGHIRALHGFTDSVMLGDPVPDGHTYSVALRFGRAFPPFGKVDAEVSLTLYGLGLSHVVLADPRRRWQVDILAGARPVSRWRTEFLVGVAMTLDATKSPLSRIPPRGTAALADALTWLNLLAVLADISRDRPVWRTKRYVSPPRLAHGDGPIGAYRKWAQQFYPALP
ncbi:Rieske 2Fe-2S domain-containing protein [Streptomyces wuyuanensis]|uniref:Rieske 2Fe-2S domain-containing protein n=1 Tax=Streptomyces wuyuanensis TaxID=1196353 RepID=UPI003421D2F7